MKYKAWERKLRAELSALTAGEREQIIDYYRELYGDKHDAGLSDDEIVAKFGPPEDCAKKIIEEQGIPQVTKRERKICISSDRVASSSILRICLYVFVIIPAFALIFTVFVSLFSIAAVGAASALGGLTVAVMAIFSGGSFGAILGNIGLGLTLCGFGILIFFISIPLTRLSVRGMSFGVKMLKKEEK